MTKKDIQKITDFIDKEIDPYDLEYDYFIEESIMCVTFQGHFTSNQEVEINFKVVNENVEVYGLCESYIYCGTREFWIELMARFSN